MLRSDFKMSSFSALKCCRCFNMTIQSIHNNDYPELDWLQCYKCPNCHHLYYQCSECMNKLMTEKKQVTDHKSYHKKKRKAIYLNPVFEMNKISKMESNSSTEEELMSNPNDFCYHFFDDDITTSSSNNVTYLKKESTNYFSNDLCTKKKLEKFVNNCI